MKLNSTLLWLGLVCLLPACEKPPPYTREELIERTLQERLEEYEQLLMTRCQEKALEHAALLIDSILIDEARANIDTINRPAKPLKPEAPERQLPRDSVPIKPLF
jgi:hypothetical protein